MIEAGQPARGERGELVQVRVATEPDPNIDVAPP